MSSIKISPKYGVNPAIPLCYYCNKPKNEVILVGRLPDDVEAPRHHVWDRHPCDKCQELMRQGVVCISVRDGEKGTDNPYRTGGWCVIRDDAIRRVFSAAYTPEAKAEAFIADVLTRRVVIVEDQAWNALGFPRGPVEGVPSE